MNDAGAIYFGKVAHRRLRPVEHRFSYRVFSFLIDLDRLDELSAGLKLFSRNRFNVFSFFDRDHGHDAPADLAEHVRSALRNAGLPADGRILLLCYPRLFGYAFNPLAVYYCHDASGKLTAIMHEVRNTFGGRHSYLIPTMEHDEVIHQEAEKVFHVSPFMPMEMIYRFRLTRPGERLSVVIRESDREGEIFQAALSGERAPLDDRALLGALLAYPLMTLKVIAAIHWEAIRLLLKGMRLLKGAPDPANAVSLVPPADAPWRKAA
jgi:hypothetical protein